MRDEIMDVKRELEEVKEKSLMLDIVSDYKKANRRQFIVILVILTMWFATMGYLVYLLNDIGTVDESTIDIEDVENIDNSHIKIGDDIWEKSN